MPSGVGEGVGDGVGVGEGVGLGVGEAVGAGVAVSPNFRIEPMRSVGYARAVAVGTYTL